MARKHAGHPASGAVGPTPSEPAVTLVDELIQQGARAIDEYDYELARATLTRAFDLSGGAEVATRALLGLLVDHLGADHDALGLAERLSREVERSPGVRLSLALAAARCGEHQRARSLLSGADGTPAADVLLVLAGAALASGDFEAATRLCDEARSHDAMHPGIQEMTYRLARAREEVRRPLEAEVTRASAAGALEEACRLAEQLLARFPESTVARRAVRAALERERGAEAERLLGAAEEALDQADTGALRAAAHAARVAVAAAPPEDRRTERLAVVEAGLAARERDASIADVVGRLGDPGRSDGLLGYAMLPPDARRCVRERIDLPMLDDLEHLVSRRVDVTDAVDALMVLGEAAATSDPERALQRLAPHARHLGHLADTTITTLRQRLEDEQRRRIAEAQAAARAALERGDPDAALVILGELPARALDATERAAVDSLRASTQALLETRALEKAYTSLLAAGDPLAAREVAERLLARAGDEERASRAALVDTAASAARKAFGVWVAQVDDAADVEPASLGPIELGAPVDIDSEQEDALGWLDAEMRSLVLLECCRQWLFFQVVDLASRRVRTRAIVRAPESLDHFTAELSPDGVFTVAGGAGAILALSVVTWDPLHWRASADIACGEVVEDIQVAPGRRHAWILSRPPDGAERLRVVDLERLRTVRDVSTDWWARPLTGADEPTMACSKRSTILSLHHPGGSPLDGGKFHLPANVRGAVVHPTDGRLLALVASHEDERLGYIEIGQHGRLSYTRWLEALNPTRAWSCATSRDHRTTFIVAYDDDDRPFLQTLGALRPSLTIAPLSRVALPTFVLLARDPTSRHVVALVADHDRLHVVPLGSGAPTFPADVSAHHRVALPGLGYSGYCERPGSAGTDVYAVAKNLKHQPAATATTWMRRHLARAGSDIKRLLEMHDVLRLAHQTQLASDVLTWMRENLPADPHAALIEAEHHAIDRRWAEVREQLEGVDLSGVIPERRQHAHHLLGLALAYEGMHERAAEVLEAGRQLEGMCPLAMLLATVDPRHETPSPDLHDLRTAIHDADVCLLRGDLAGAHAVLDVRVVWDGEEVQSLARLADVALQAEPETALGKFRKALALARFLAAHRQFSGLRCEVPLPGTGWAPERIAEVERRAQTWLERHDTAELPTPSWSLALHEFDESLAAITADEAPRAPVRLAFRIRHAGHTFAGIDPVLQRALRNGRFSAGQIADGNAILAAQGQFVDDADAAAVLALSEGLAPASRSRTSPSRVRMLRLLGALVDHPRVFLDELPDVLVSVQRTRLGISCIVTPDGLTLHFVLGGARWTATELLASAELSMAVDVDADARTVTLAPIGPAAQALAEALERHHPVFPVESHGELLRRLIAIQHGVDLHLPDALAGTARPTDSRPVVRITPEEEVDMLLEIGVRPLAGAGFTHPGEGTVRMFAVLDDSRASALRDHPSELAAAERVRAGLPLVDATREAKWRYRITGEERILAVIEALSQLGPEIVVEWPKDARLWRWCGTVKRNGLRVHITHDRHLLRVEGDIDVDGHRVAIEALLEAIRLGRRYVIVGPRLFGALGDELRERLEAAEPLLFAGHGALEAGHGAAPVLVDLADERLSGDAAWYRLREDLGRALDLDPAVPAGLRADLRPYQHEGFRWLVRLAAWGVGALLADDMGLGKTLQALALLVHRAERGPALVIAPTSVTPNWLAEAARFAPGLRARPYRGPNRGALLADARAGDVFIAGYGVVTRDADALATTHFSTLVLDEAQALKNAASRRTRAVQQLQADFRVALTGTPVENHLGELWSLFKVLSPGLLGTWPQFRDRFAAPIERDRSATQRAALGRVLRPFLLRRTKEAVLPELPPRIDVTRLVNLSAAEQELYETARLAAAAAIAEATDPRERFAVLGWLTRLRRLACHPRLLDPSWSGVGSKLEAFLAIVDELREAGHRALVFSQFTDHLAVVREALAARDICIQYLDGSTPVDERARAVDAFQGGAGELFLISLKAGGTGLNLTAADHVIHLDPWWNPAVEDQATDRAHRIGQSRPVTVIRLIARSTIEEAVLALHAEKRDLAEGLLAGADIVGRLSTQALADLVRHGSGSAEFDDEPDPDPADARGSTA